MICEKACKFYSSNFNLNIGILRLFSTFGPDLKRQVIYDTIKKIKTLKKFKIIGDGNEIRNFCYINDQVKSIMQLSKKVKRPKGEIYNIASGRKFAIKQILKKLIKISNKKVNYIFTNKRRSFDTKNFIANKSKLFKTIGKHSLTPMEVALRKTYQSY